MCLFSTQTCISNNYSWPHQRRTHPLTLHPLSNTDILAGLLIRQLGVACGGILTTSLWAEEACAALRQLLSRLEWFCCDGGQLKLYIWEMKKNTWCWTYWGSPWRLQAKASQLGWRSQRKPEDLDKVSMTCWERQNIQIQWKLAIFKTISPEPFFTEDVLTCHSKKSYITVLHLAASVSGCWYCHCHGLLEQLNRTKLLMLLVTSAFTAKCQLWQRTTL